MDRNIKDVLCWKCLKKIGQLPIHIGFRMTCNFCDADLHVCKNCKYYAPGKPNDCLVPGTDLIQDREKANFCEEFRLKTPIEGQKDRFEKARKIFQEDELPKKKDFNDLFKNDSK